MRLISNKFEIGFYEAFLLFVIVLQFGGILYTHSYLSGAQISDFLGLKTSTIQLAAFKSANLPVYYLFEFLYKTLGLSNEVIKAIISLLALSVISISIYRIALCLFDNKAAGIFAAAIFLFSSLYFAAFFSNTSFIDDSNPDALSYAFLMLAILFWLKDCYKTSSLFMGLSLNSHPILPIGFVVAFFAYLFVCFKKIGRRDLILSVLVFLIVTAPVTLSVMQTAFFTIKNVVMKELDGDLIWRYVRVAQPQTAFVNIDNRFKYGVALYLSSLLLVLQLYHSADKDKREKYFKSFLLLSVIFSLALFDILNSYYFKIIPIFNLWLHRFMAYGSAIIYIILAGTALKVELGGAVSSAFRTVLFLLLSFSVIIANYGYLPLIWINHLCILGISTFFFGYKFFSNKKISFNYSLASVALLVLASAYLCYMAFYAAYAFRGIAKIGFTKLLPMLPLFLITLLFYYLIFRFKSDIRIYRNSIALMVVVLASLGLYAKYKSEDYTNSTVYKYDRPLMEWVRNNSKETDEFLIPFDFFAWQESKRPAFYDANVVNAASYNKKFMVDAIRRFQILAGIDLKKLSKEEIDTISPIRNDQRGAYEFLNERYANLSGEKIYAIKKDFGIKYFVASSTKTYDFPVVYKNEKYFVYKLDK